MTAAMTTAGTKINAQEIWLTRPYPGHRPQHHESYYLRLDKPGGRGGFCRPNQHEQAKDDRGRHAPDQDRSPGQSGQVCGGASTACVDDGLAVMAISPFDSVILGLWRIGTMAAASIGAFAGRRLQVSSGFGQDGAWFSD